jgi:HlyD family secretion protein
VQTRWLDAGGHEVARREGDTTQRETRVAYVVERGIAHRREVKTGLQDELWVEVAEGLRQGERVVTGPYRILRDLKDKDTVENAPARSPTPGSAGGENSSDH